MTAVPAARASGRWTLRVCEECRKPRMMPVDELLCRHCSPGGSPRSWRLRKLREARLLEERSPEEVARLAGVSVATVCRAERGGRVQARTAAKLAGALGASVRELAHGAREPEAAGARRETPPGFPRNRGYSG